MGNSQIERQFSRIGARVRIHDFDLRGNPWRRMGGRLLIDIGQDRHGEYFDVTVNKDRSFELSVLDVKPDQRHLLLMVDDGLDVEKGDREGKQKFLCGHDERHWFVAAVPEKSSASNVKTAFEALKPWAVRDAEARVGLKGRHRNRRKNRAFVRQGEWFFIPQPDLVVDPVYVLNREPLRRGSGKAHMAEFCYREGGETVYVSHLHPNGLTEKKYKAWIKSHPKSRVKFQAMRRNPGVYVKGRIRHPDHQTIRLHVWHRVEMNTETEARAMSHVAFID